jgi:uncharacterized protein (TIGR02271 family)
MNTSNKSEDPQDAGFTREHRPIPGTAAGAPGRSAQAADLRRFIDCAVVDRQGDKVGTVEAVWEDHTGQPAYLAVRTGWLGLGRIHVVPAYAAEINEYSSTIRVPYEGEVIKQAPSFDSQAEIDDRAEHSIREHFRIPRAAGETPAAGTTRSDEATMKLKSEDVNIGKREVEYGGVRLRKVVRTERVNQPVDLKREEVVVERTPVHGEPERGRDARIAEGEKEIYLPLRREEPVVEKKVRTDEEVRVGKRTETDRREVSETFRKEDVEVESEGGAKTPGRGSKRPDR